MLMQRMLGHASGYVRGNVMQNRYGRLYGPPEAPWSTAMRDTGRSSSSVRSSHRTSDTRPARSSSSSFSRMSTAETYRGSDRDITYAGSRPRNASTSLRTIFRSRHTFLASAPAACSGGTAAAAILLLFPAAAAVRVVPSEREAVRLSTPRIRARPCLLASRKRHQKVYLHCIVCTGDEAAERSNVEINMSLRTARSSSFER